MSTVQFLKFEKCICGNFVSFCAILFILIFTYFWKLTILEEMPCYSGTCPCSLDDLIHEFEKCGLEDHEMQWTTRLEECVLTKRVGRSGSPSLFLLLTS